MTKRDAYIIGGSRTPFFKSMTTYNAIKLQDLMTDVLQHMVDKFSLHDKVLGDVALGAIVTKPVHWNLARECVLGTTLNPHTPAYNTQRACGTSLEAARQ
jgi:acetyl-CoA C-acetyltransferase